MIIIAIIYKLKNSMTIEQQIRQYLV